MELIAVGLNHETAPVEVRERIAVPAARFREAMSSLTDHVPHGLVLSTCNRTEVYALEDGCCPAEEGILGFLCRYSALREAQLLPYLFQKRQEEVVRHLYRVASGLESMIVGEYEVLGQVRDVLEEAESMRTVNLLLLNLFRQAVRVGRRVRSETAISRNAASVSSAAVEVARNVFGELSGCGVLVIGAGQAGKLAVRALTSKSVIQIAVVSRSYDRALELAQRLGGVAVHFHGMKEALTGTDIVICCSGSSHFVLEPDVVDEVARLRKDRPLLIIDIAVPRDVHPDVRGLDGVVLYDIDDLEAVAKMNRRQREREVEKASAIVEDEVARFMTWWGSRKSLPAINDLLERAESIRKTQFEKTIKGINGLSDGDRERLEAMTRSIVQKLLHEPIAFLKNSNGKDCVQTVRAIFGLDGENS
jgi:glutamyl-tRNA reductase